MGNATFMYMDSIFFFFFEHCQQGSKYQARLPIEFFDMEPFFFKKKKKVKWLTE